ncbi:unnamed protein product, partial [Rangifer tarandus platyrhynchus]
AQSSRSCARTAGARPCPQVAGRPAPRRLLALADPRAHPAAVAGSGTHLPRTPTPDVKRDRSPSPPPTLPAPIDRVLPASPVPNPAAGRCGSRPRSAC